MARINTFDEAVKWFEATLPLRGPRAKQVIRPLGQRNRPWERIEKVNDNCYFLTDGWGSWGMGADPTPSTRNVVGTRYVECAPIMWERREDGEYLRVRNCLKGSGSPSRFNFTRWNLPNGLTFKWGDNDHKSGKHYIVACGEEGHEKFFLPKFKIECRNQLNQQEVTEDSGEMLWFKRVGNGVWQRVGEMMGEPVKRLNKPLAAEYKQAIYEFYSFMGATIPALGFMDNDARSTYWKMLSTSGNDHYYWGRNLTHLNRPELVREILMQYDHPMRVALAVHVANDMDVYQRSGRYVMNFETLKNEWRNEDYMNLPETEDEAKALRRKYMSVIRKAAGMFEVVYK